MKREETKRNATLANDMVKGALDSLMRSLGSGYSQGLREYLKAMARFRRYSAANVLLIHTQRPGASYVLGYSAWKKLGRQVRKGEKGILIRAPRTRRADDRDDQCAGNVVIGFGPAYVFDIAQTDGDDVPTVADVTGEPGELLSRLKSFAADNAIEVAYSPELAPALGASIGGKVLIAEDLSPPEECSVLAHEIAHELLHKTPGERPSRNVRETEAEAVAFVVCQAAGLDATQAAADYIHLHDGCAETLWGSLDRVQQTASRMIHALGFDDHLAHAA